MSETFKFDPEEIKIAEFRKHWWTLAVEIGFSFLLVIGPIFLLSFLYANFDLTPKVALFLLMLFVIWIFCASIFCFVVWMNYYLDIWILTNKRLIDVNQKSLFHRDIASLRLESIQDIKIEIIGIIHTFLKIGNIHVQTAATSNEFTMMGIQYPEIAKETISRAQQAEMEKVKTVKIAS